MLPYLKDGAVVVLHDVALNHYSRPAWTNAYCTGLLFGAVSAEKFLNFIQPNGGGEIFRYPNIAAFQINEQTRRNIDQIFLALSINWFYMPKPDEIRIYLAHYQRFYPSELCKIFVEALKMNLHNLAIAPYI